MKQFTLIQYKPAQVVSGESIRLVHTATIATSPLETTTGQNRRTGMEEEGTQLVFSSLECCDGVFDVNGP